MLSLFLLWMLYLRGSADATDLRELHDTQLIDTTLDYEGIVSVMLFNPSAFQSEMYIVCANKIDMQDANVVCRQLGFSSAKEIEAVNYTNSGKRWLLNVNCIGSEPILQNCTYTKANGNACSNSQAAKVKCQVNKENQQRFDVRLIEGSANSSIVQVYGRSHWSPVCTQKNVFEAKSQNVVCRELGFSKAMSGSAGKFLDNYTGGISIELSRCDGDELSLKQCDLGWGSMDKSCGNGKFLGIQCAATKVSTLDLCSNQDITIGESWADDKGQPVFAAFFHSPDYPNLFNYTGNTSCKCEVTDGDEDATIKVYIHYRMFENSFNESITLSGTEAESNSASKVTIDGATSNVGTYTYKARQFIVKFSSEGMIGNGKFRIQLRATKNITFACLRFPVPQTSTPSSEETASSTTSSSTGTVPSNASSSMGTVATPTSQMIPATWTPSRVTTGTTVPGSSSEPSTLSLIVVVTVSVFVGIIVIIIIVVCLIRKKRRPKEKAITTCDDYEKNDLELFDVGTNGRKKKRTNVSNNEDKEMNAYDNEGMVDTDLNESSDEAGFNDLAHSSTRVASVEKQPEVLQSETQFHGVQVAESEAGLSPSCERTSISNDYILAKDNPTDTSPENITGKLSNDVPNNNELVCVNSAKADPSGIYAEVGGGENGPKSNKRYPGAASYEDVEINPITENTSHPTKSKTKSKKKKSGDKHKKNKSKKQTDKERNVEVSNSVDNSTFQITSDKDKAGPIYADVVPKSKRKKESEDDYDLLDRSLLKTTEPPAVPPKTEDQSNGTLYSTVEWSQSNDGSLADYNPASVSPYSITNGLSNYEPKKNQLVSTNSTNADPLGIYAEVGGGESCAKPNKRYPGAASYEDMEINPIMENAKHPSKNKKKNKSKKHAGNERNLDLGNDRDKRTFEITSDKDIDRDKAPPIYAQVSLKSKRKKESEDDFGELGGPPLISPEPPEVPPKTDQLHEPIYSTPDRSQSQSRAAANDVRPNEESGEGVYGKLKFPSVKAPDRTPTTLTEDET